MASIVDLFVANPDCCGLQTLSKSGMLNARQDDMGKKLARDTEQGGRTTVTADILGSFPLV